MNKKSKHCSLGWDTVLLGRNVLTFRWNFLPPHEEGETKFSNKAKIAGIFCDYTEYTQQL